MIVDIFSSFDPATSSLHNISASVFWLFNLAVLLIIHPLLWISPSRRNWLISTLTRVINEQVTRTFSNNLKGFGSILTSLFIIIIALNFCGIVPYVFSVTAHLIFALALGLPLWVRLIISGVVKAPTAVVAGLLPSGAPWWLNPFLVLVETVRIIVRPITLSFRLAANITAGHVVLTLLRVYLSDAIFLRGPLSWVILLLIQVGYTLFEFGICIIQGYIFCLLLSLYRDDHPS